MSKDAKKKNSSSKKNLIRTDAEKNRNKIIALIVVLLIAALVYFLIDSGSYIATIDGYRIPKSEFMFFLDQQMVATENEEGLSTKDEKEAFWTTPADGQDPYETAKRETLNYLKEFMIQYIKAQESGLKVTAESKEQSKARVESIKMSLGLTDKQLEQQYKINSRDLQALYEKIAVIDEYKKQYIDNEFTAPEFTDQELKDHYEESKRDYDKVDISYITFYKFNDESQMLSEEEVAEKMKTAEEALKKAQEGENMDTLVTQYTEEDAESAGADPSRQIGKATISYSQDSSYEYFMDWSLIEWAFDNKIGDAGIVESTYFIYVAKIEGRTDFDDVKTDVNDTMTSNASEEFYDDAIESWGLESKYNIIKNDRVYESISYK